MYFELRASPFEQYGVKKWPEVPDGVGGFQWGDRIDVDVPQPVEYLVDYTSEHPPVDLVTTFMTVMSDRLVDALHEAGVDNLQTFKAVLKNPDTGETWDNYQTVNVVGRRSCADMENSEYKVLLPPSCMFKKLVIDVDKAKGGRFFRLVESLDTIIVHDDVLDYLYDKNDDPLFNGVELEPIVSSHNIGKES